MASCKAIAACQHRDRNLPVAKHSLLSVASIHALAWCILSFSLTHLMSYSGIGSSIIPTSSQIIAHGKAVVGTAEDIVHLDANGFSGVAEQKSRQRRTGT